MSVLTLIRHGQATAFAKNWDRLTTLGEQQAHKLGEAWAAQNIQFNRVVCGKLQRQKLTAEIACSYLQKCPDIEQSAAYNEYDATGITGMELSPELEMLRSDFLLNRESEDRNKYFQKFLEGAMKAWLAGEIVSPRVESAEAFFERVEKGLRSIMNESKGNQRIAVFTSGGVIGRAVQWSTFALIDTALALNWRVRNCSLTEFLFSGERVSLDLFNATAHLPPDMITYR